MKLLPKTEINKRVNEQNKVLIDSGAFIARKVDALREEMLELQKNRDLFIQGSQQVINDSLAPLLIKVEETKKEIERLEEIRKDLLEPKTEEEWSELAKEVLIYSVDKDKFQVENKQLNEDKEIIEKIKQETNTLFQQAKDKEAENDKLLKNTALLNQLAKQNFDLAVSERLTQTKEHEKLTKELEGKIKTYENGIKQYEEKDKDITRREQQLLSDRRHLESQQTQMRIALEVIKNKQYGTPNNKSN